MNIQKQQRNWVSWGLIGWKGLKTLDFVKSPDNFFRPETGNDGNSQKSTQK